MSLLQVDSLSLDLRGDPVLRGINLTIEASEIAGVVGESGAGKSMLGKAILGVLPRDVTVTGGSIRLGGTDLLALRPRARRALLKRDMALIPQDPLSALNPCRTISAQLAEVLPKGTADAKTEVIRWLDAVRIPSATKVAKSFPHVLSGGMRQRALIAAAFASRPKLVIADEPTTALDVTVQKDILNLIREMQRETGVGLMFVTHDLCVVAKICHSVTVMHGGRVIEQAACTDLINRPAHAYSQALLAATPRPDQAGQGLEPVPTALIERMIAEAGDG